MMIRFWTVFFFFLNQAAHFRIPDKFVSVTSSFHRASAACLFVLIFLLVLQIVPVSVGSVYKRSGLECAFVMSAFNVVGFMDLFVFVFFLFCFYQVRSCSLLMHFCFCLFVCANSIMPLPYVFTRSSLWIISNSCCVACVWFNKLTLRWNVDVN